MSSWKVELRDRYERTRRWRRVRRAYWKRHIKGARVPKKEKSPRAGRRDGRRETSISPRRDKTSHWRFAPVASPSIPRVSRFFIFRYLLVVLSSRIGGGKGIALRSISPPLLFFRLFARSSLRGGHENKSERLGGRGRETACLCGASYSLVPTSRFAFYIIFILLHFSQDKCLRGFASRLGKYFHNVLLCRPLPVSSSRFALPRAFGFFLRSRTRNRGIK